MKNWSWIYRRPNAYIGAGLLCVVLGIAVLGVFYTPYDPLAMDFRARLSSGGEGHMLGTDQFGRDVLSRIMAAAGVSVSVSLLTVVFALFFGTLIGAVTGYLGGWFDRIVMTFMDAFMAFPGILLALAIMAIMGPNKYGVVLALGLAYTPNVVRVVRGTVFSLREKEYVEASIALGNSELYTILRHIVPNCISPLTVLGSSIFGGALLSESALSFLGLGVPPPDPSWGGMLADGRQYLATAPWLVYYPGMAISLTLLGINLFGDALRDKFDPRMNQL
tara:strand:+ start:7434 stop:8264 length:831 start_codon:yes stop_codon:yes gene_type:complete